MNLSTEKARHIREDYRSLKDWEIVSNDKIIMKLRKKIQTLEKALKRNKSALKQGKTLMRAILGVHTMTFHCYANKATIRDYCEKMLESLQKP